MSQNIWKILSVTFFAISLLLFIGGYTYIKNSETSHLSQMKELETKTTIQIKELEMRIKQDSLQLKALNNPLCPPGKRPVMVGGVIECIDVKKSIEDY